jgi:hypothetical protein
MNKRQIEESAKAGPAARQGHGKATPTARQSHGGNPLPVLRPEAPDAIGVILHGIHYDLARIRVAVERISERQMIAATIGGIDSSRFANALAGLIDAAIKAGIMADEKTSKALDALAVKGQ